MQVGTTQKGRTGGQAIEGGLRIGEQVGVVAALAELHDQRLQLRPRLAVLVVLQRTQHFVAKQTSF
jgi:hypothetical protein